MKKLLKNYKLNLFTYIELIFSFMVSSTVLSIDLGYFYRVRANTATGYDTYLLLILNIFTFLAIVVTAIGIMGIQLINIYRRTYEIGLHRAVGANNLDIILLVLKDTFFLILIPALGGTLAGIALSNIIPFHKIGLEVHINIGLLLMCTVFLVLFTLLSGLLPAVKAVRMKPVEVLRKNSPISSQRQKMVKVYTRGFYFVAGIIIIIGIVINHKLEAQYKEDIINTTGSPPATSNEVPGFTFRNEEGEIISSDSLKGKSYCLVIWEVGCPVSPVVFEELNRLLTEETMNKMDIYAVNIDKTMSEVKEYNQTNAVLFEPFIDYKKSTKWAFHASAVPAIYIIDENGIIKARSIGWSEAMKDYITQKIAKG